MNATERIQMVKAMEFIIRHVNDEELTYNWLSLGVADGDIEPGDLTVTPKDFDEMEYYIDDDELRDLMHIFLMTMKYAYKDGGLYCDGLCNKDKR